VAAKSGQFFRGNRTNLPKERIVRKIASPGSVAPVLVNYFASSLPGNRWKLKSYTRGKGIGERPNYPRRTSVEETPGQ